MHAFRFPLAALALLGATGLGAATNVATVIASGESHNCVITTDGGLKCWGSNSQGQLGDGTRISRTSPVDVVGLPSGVTAIVAGQSHSCALTATGGVKCWGGDSYGQLGDNSGLIGQLTPVDVSGLTSGVVAIASGLIHTCALTAAGGVKCWGANYLRQLGDGSFEYKRNAPVEVVGLSSGIAAIGSGSYHSCAITTGGGAKCWGMNSNGQLGNGATATTGQNTPSDVIGLSSGVTAITGGNNQTCAITSGGGVKCWGSAYTIGVGVSGTNYLQPIDAMGVSSGAIAVDTGSGHTCVLLLGGAVKCAGDNYWGPLGDGSGVGSLVPVDVPGLTAMAIAAGDLHTCALTTAGAAKCWGKNDFGQLGDGTLITRFAPVDVYGLPTPPTTPGAPIVGTAVAGNASATITFSPPESDGGATISGYTATSDSGGISGNAAASPIVVRGLAAGVTYTFTVTATNGAGVGPPSAPSNAVVPTARVPDPPVIVSVMPGNGQLTVGFLPPTLDGGAPITEYVASCAASNGSGTFAASGAASPLTVGGVTNGIIYACWVVATNSAGSSDRSAISTALTPDSAGSASLQLDPPYLVFAARLPGTTSASRSLTLTNSSAVSRTITSISASGDFAVSGCGTLPITLAAGATCSLEATFTPTSSGARTGVVAVTIQGYANAAGTRLFGSGSPLRAGLDDNVFVSAAGEVWSWGSNYGGKLGNGITTDSTVPVKAIGLTNVVAIAPGGSHTLALKADGTVWAWGLNDKNQLGYSTTASADSCHIPGTIGTGYWPCSRQPRPVPGLTNVVAIAAGWVHSVALRSDGSVWTWGSNASNQLGRSDVSTPYSSAGPITIAAALGDIVEIAVGGFHNLARNSFGQWVAWGHNADAQLGNGTTTAAPVPVAVSFSDFSAIIPNGSHNIALKSDGTVWTWGWNRYGQLGTGDATIPPASSTVPVQVPGLTSIVEVAAGYSSSFARQSNGTVWSWGLNKSGQLGAASADNCGSANNRPCARAPLQAPTHAGAIGIIAGGAHTIALRPNHSLVPFGENASGQLGNATAAFPAFGGAVIFDPDVSTSTFYCPPGQRCLGLTSSGGSVGLGSSSGGLDFDNLDSALDFAPRLRGTTSAASTLTLTNHSKDAFTIYGMSISGDFAASSDCGFVTQSTSCSINITFAPSGPGLRRATLTFTTDRYDSPVYSLDAVGFGLAPPSEPRNVTAAGGNAQATVSFAVPLEDGGAAITSYTVTANPGGASASASSSPIVVTGLANGTAYRFTVRATNAYGLGDPSAASNSVTPQAPPVPPSAPTITSVTAGNGQLSVAFTVTSGGSCATTYTVTCNPGNRSASSQTSPIVVTGLANGTAYSCTIHGTNCAGTGASTSPVSATPFAPFAGHADFNADDKPDILWSNSASGATYVWYMNGPALQSDAFIAQIDPSWKVQGVGDFNGDGHPDLIWRNTANGNTYVWYMNGPAFISDAFVFSLPPQWVIQGVADFNGDGHPDFLMRNTDPASGVGFVWFFNNATPIGDQFLFGIDPSWKVEQVGDLNGDGQPDLLFRNMSSGLAFSWYTQYSGGNLSLAGSSAPIFSIDPVWEIVQLADWNGDGYPDLLFRNATTGVVFVWYMTGTTLGSSDYVIQIDPSWEIVPRR